MGAVAMRVLWGALTFGITLPVWAFLAAGLWLWLDRTSSMRQAVDRAVTTLVDGAELEAERARVAALERIIDRQRELAERDRAAMARFSDLLTASEENQKELADELAEIASAPPPDACTVDRALLDRLRQ